MCIHKFVFIYYIYIIIYIYIYIYTTFLSEGHHGLENDCEITLIDKTDPSDPTRGIFLLFIFVIIFSLFNYQQ